MKNIQIIDGASNCAYDIYQAADEEFSIIFPNNKQDIQFIEDLIDVKGIQEVLENLWSRPIDKKNVAGIHGTLFYELEYKKKYYPNRREKDLTNARGRPQQEENSNTQHE